MPRKWSPDDVRDLRADYGSTGDSELARRFRCSVREIQLKALELALNKDKRTFIGRVRQPPWTESEIEILQRAYPAQSSLAIAKRLGRTVRSVRSKAHRMGLEKSRSRIQEANRQNHSLRRQKSS